MNTDKYEYTFRCNEVKNLVSRLIIDKKNNESLYTDEADEILTDVFNKLNRIIRMNK